MHGLQMVQDAVESRTAECERTIHLKIDARRRFIEICEDQHLAIAYSEDDAGPPTGFFRRQVSMGFDNEARDQAWRQIAVYITKAQRIFWPFAVEATARRQGLRNEIAFLLWRRQTEAKADVAILHHVEDEFMSDRKSTRLNSSHQIISYAVFCLKKKNDST